MLPGLRYTSAFLGEAEEAALIDQVRRLPFASIRLRGRVARRRTAQYGWVYGYASSRVEPGPAIPGFLEPLRERAALLAGVAPVQLAEALVAEYPPGAGIGWHCDARPFGLVVGVSLLGGCRLRFRCGIGPARRTRAIALEPRSAYVLEGEARWRWQHSIAALKVLRYSVTFRTLAAVDTPGLSGPPPVSSPSRDFEAGGAMPRPGRTERGQVRGIRGEQRGGHPEAR